MSDPIRIEEYIEALPEEVFEHFADPSRQPVEHPLIEFGAETDRESPRRIEWAVTVRDGAEQRDGRVEIALAPDGSGTRVRVTHEIGEVIPRARALAA